MKEFWKSSRTPDGYLSRCIACEKEKSKIWRDENKGRLKESWKKSRINKKLPDDERIRRKKGESRKEHNELNRIRYKLNFENISKRRKEKVLTPELRKKLCEYVKKSRKLHREKHIKYQIEYHKKVKKFQVHQKVYYAVKTGKLIKPLYCEKCGENKPLQGHHHDYSKPLDVLWVCLTCHCQIHKKLLYLI